MKILFDYKIFYQQKYGGISNYFYNLGKEFIKLEQNFIFSTPIHKNEYIAKLNSNFVYGFKFKFLPHNLNIFFENFNYFFTQNKIKTFKPDIIHESYYSKKNSNNNTVCTVYDLINEKFPNYFSNSSMISKMKEETFKRVDHIICISENTKKDLIEFFNINEEKITVTLLATDYQKTHNLKKKLKNKLLFVGSRRGYKNFEGLIQAFSISKFLKSNFQLIAYGGEKFNVEDKKILEKYNLNNNNVEFINDTTVDINYLYNNVAAFVFPSLYEGFGLPVLEAMRCGCPVILSNGGSLKEVGGDKLDYFDPQNVENIKYNIEKMLLSEDLQNKTIEYGFTRSKKFSWEKCAKETLQVYKRQLK